MNRTVAACLVIAGLMLLWTGSPAAAGTWTNAAGNAMEADFVELRGKIVVFSMPDGATMEMPLASLAVAERQRALDRVGRVNVPPALRADYGLCVRTLKRLGSLHGAGKITLEENQERSASALRLLDAACVREKLSRTERDKLLAAVERS